MPFFSDTMAEARVTNLGEKHSLLAHRRLEVLAGSAAAGDEV
jgi:hypothetical protein